MSSISSFIVGGAMDSTVYRGTTLHIEGDGWLRYQTVKIINGNNVISVDFRNEVRAAA